MRNQKNVAKALLRGKLPTREIAGIIYDEADLLSPVAMQTPPPIEHVEAAAKKSWIKAAVAVMSKVPEYRGSHVVRHKSKNLKAVYAQYGDDQATLQQLHEYAKGSWARVIAWAENVDLEWLVAHVRRGNVDAQAWTVLGRRLMAAKRYETIANWRYAAGDPRNAFLGAAFAYGVEQDDIDTVEAYLGSLRSNKTRIEAIWSGWAMLNGVLNRSMLHVLRTYHKDGGEVFERLEDSFDVVMPANEEVYGELLAYLPEGALHIVDEDFQHKHLRTTLRYADYETVHKTIETMLGHYGPEHYKDDTTAQAELDRHEVLQSALEALERFEPTGDEDGVRGIFHGYRYALSPAATYQALRFGSYDETWEWLLSREMHRPTEEVFNKLLANPGRAFLQEGVPVQPEKPISWETFAAAKRLYGFTALLDLPFVDGIIEAMGAAGTALLLEDAEMEADGVYGYSEPGTLASDYLARRFTEALGADGDAWRGALQIVATSTQPLGRTLRGIATLYRNSGTGTP